MRGGCSEGQIGNDECWVSLAPVAPRFLEFDERVEPGVNVVPVLVDCAFGHSELLLCLLGVWIAASSDFGVDPVDAFGLGRGGTLCLHFRRRFRHGCYAGKL